MGDQLWALATEPSSLGRTGACGSGPWHGRAVAALRCGVEEPFMFRAPVEDGSGSNLAASEGPELITCGFVDRLLLRPVRKIGTTGAGGGDP